MNSKTNTFFVISNYNTDPEGIINYCADYIIYDQSNDDDIKQLLGKKYQKIIYSRHTGHNISDYLEYITSNYDSLPDWVMFGKGNMVGRHITREYFEKVYARKEYTMLWHENSWVDQPGVAYRIEEGGGLLEVNNSWYFSSKEYKYFYNLNNLRKFIFKDIENPAWSLFSPGACYIVSRGQIKKYPKNFWENLKKILNYRYFPSEAYGIERMLHTIFTGQYMPNHWMYSGDAFDVALKIQELECMKYKNQPSRKKRIISKIVKYLNF